MDDLVEIRVTFEYSAGENGDPPAFRDALYFTPEEYAAITLKELDEQKQQRYQDWLKSLKQSDPPDPAHPDPTPTDVGQQLADIAQQATALAQQALDAAANLPQEVFDGAQATEEPSPRIQRKARRAK